MNNQELINQLRLFIQGLEHERAALTEGSKAYRDKQKLIQDFATSLNMLTGNVSAAESAITKLERQLNNLFSTISRGKASGSVRLEVPRGEGQTPRTMVRIPQLIGVSDIAKSEIQKAAARRPEEIQKALEYTTTPEYFAQRKKGEQTLASHEKLLETVRAETEREVKRRLKAEQEAARAAEKLARQKEKEAAAAGDTPLNRLDKYVTTPEDEVSRRMGDVLSGKPGVSAESKQKSESFRDEYSRLVSDMLKKAEEEVKKSSDSFAQEVDEALRNAHPGNDEIPKARAAWDSLTDAQKAAAEKLGTETTNKLKEAGSKISKEMQKLLQSLEEQEKRANFGDYIPGGQFAANRANQVAQKINPNFTPDTIKSVLTTDASGISRITYQYKNAEGVINRLILAVDKFGRVLVDNQNRFRSFGNAIARDIVELTKWSIAIAIVYGPMQKLQQLVSEMITNEARLADVTIALGNAQRSTAEIFSAAESVARATGESISGVIEAFNLAYRAAGDITDATTRFNTATKLLSDAIILSKLSTLDEAQAIDLLSAALKQTRQELVDGTALLDKWVAVTKVANVDLETLATGFSVLGDSAMAAGIEVDQLNAVIAVIAEASGQGAREIANTARAIIGGFQSDAARAQLQQLGISLTDSEGKAKNFLEIIKEINQLRSSGFLSEDQFSKLTLVLGGGVRRQAAVSTFINTVDKKSAAVIAASEAAQAGEASEALAEKLDTVETAVTRLNNAFTSLAQALGDQGGLLGIFKGILNVLSGIVEGVSSLTTMLGKAGPALYATIIASKILSTGMGKDGSLGTYGGALRENLASIAGNFSGALAMSRRGATEASAFDSAIRARDFIQNDFRIGKFRTNALGIGAGVLATGTAVAGNLAEGKTSQAIGNIVGGAIGMGIGTALGGPVGTAIGASLGSSIVEGIINAGENFKPELQDLFAPTRKPTVESKENVLDLTPEELYAQRRKEATDYLKKVTGTPDWLGGLKTSVLNIPGAAANTMASWFGQDAGFTGYNDAQMLLLDLEFKRGMGVTTQKEYDEAIRKLQEAEALNPARLQQAQEIEAQNRYGPSIEAAQRAESARLLQDLRDRRIGKAAYERGTTGLDLMGSAGSQFYEAFGSQGYGTQDKFFRDFARISARASQEEIDVLTQYKQQIIDANKVLQTASKSSEEYAIAQEKIGKAVLDANTYMMGLNESLLAQVNLLNVGDFSDYTKEEFSIILEEGKKTFDELIKYQIKLGVITQEEADAYVKNLEKFIPKVKEGYLDPVSGVPLQYINQAEQEKRKADSIGFQQFDVDRQQMQQYVGLAEDSEMYKKYRDLFVSMGYKEDRTDTIAILNDGLIKPMNKDWKIVQYLLSEILKTEQKQLDGMFNLPSGASFWIPYQAAKYGLKGTEPELPTVPEVTEPIKKEEEPLPVSEIKTPTTPVGYEDAWRKFKEAEMASYKDVQPVPEVKYKTYADQMKAFREADQVSMLNANAARPDIAENLVTALKNLDAAVTINLTSTSTIVVDGRQLAEVVNKYNAQDRARFGAGSSTTTNSVIGVR